MTSMPFSRRMRRWKLGLKTLFGSEPAGYFIPYRYAAETQKAVGRPTYPAIEAMMEQAAPTMKAWLTKAALYQDAFASFGNASPPEPRWQQSWFPRLDGMMAYVFTREFRPNRIIEIGSGHSTRFYYRAIKDGDLPTRFHAIDPPRAPTSPNCRSRSNAALSKKLTRPCLTILSDRISCRLIPAIS